MNKYIQPSGTQQERIDQKMIYFHVSAMGLWCKPSLFSLEPLHLRVKSFLFYSIRQAFIEPTVDQGPRWFARAC